MAIPKQPLNELMQTIKANITRYRTQQASLPESANWHLKRTTSTDLTSTIMALYEEPEIEYTTRTADQEVCAVEICPDHPEYMIIGTYSLVKKDDRRDYEAQTRRGTIQVMPVAATFKPKYAGMLAPQLDRVAFPCAVLDLHFHPADSTLLGVATSNAQMQFFRFVKHGDVLGRRVITKLLPLGVATVAEADEHGLVPLVTQFTWFPETRTHGVSGINDVQEIVFAVTTSLGETRVVHTAVPAIRGLFDQRLSTQSSEPLAVKAVDVHKHDLEAWTVAAVPLGYDVLDDGSHDATLHRLILSGGDDSALIASMVEMPAHAPDSSGPSEPDEAATDITPLWKDRRSHTAGVVAILPLPRLQAADDNNSSPGPGPGGRQDASTIVPLVTGSYDEFIRVYELDVDRHPHRAAFQTELRLGGGVWRLKVLDQYSDISSIDDSASTNNTNRSTNTPSSTSTSIQPNPQHYHNHHTLVLASLMHGGAAILRLTRTHCMSVTSPHSHTNTANPRPTRSSPQPADSWTITPLATFRTGHESMVYCCDAWLEEPKTYTYTIVSTSFYDMKICTWKYVDRFKADIFQNRNQGQG
ncbi:hypothetical protein A1O1_06179 [Capronia coronata CBS 617.96]|uniref:Uncharacterized protein n=1 Tax=Capronia coronata CBS 617.96 TaxID=1182541 RepID=W9Y852_9EURO|nr:uncharacterized protein A1O1_06179 [Capronia coronata CBS 617.96]EXJ85810.1 hypothetical protein A1O1_06179 [Capronia coronata CBS 617.96]